MDTLLGTLRTSSHDALWFWVFIALVWILCGARVLGAPWDMVQEMRGDADKARDVKTLVRVTSQRLSDSASSPLLWAGISCGLSSLGIVGFFYQSEFAQACFMLLAPLCAFWVLRVRAAQRFLTSQPEGDALYEMLTAHRWVSQIVITIGVVLISLWGGVQTVINSTFQ